MEEWVIIEEAPRYLVSNQGRVFSTINKIVLSPGLAGKGYETIILMHNGQRLQRYIHILVAVVFVSGWFEGAEVNHKDTNKRNNAASNLEWSTHLENQQHASKMGVMANSGQKKTPIRIVETGEVFISQHACARAIGGLQSSIHACLSGRIKQYMGYTFEYVIE